MYRQKRILRAGMQILFLRDVSRALGPDFALKIPLHFWQNRRNTKCSGFPIDISLNSDIIEAIRMNALPLDSRAASSCKETPV